MTILERKQLGEIIHADGAVNWWQPDLFAKHVRLKLPDVLHILSPPPTKDKNYNCFIYMLGLADTNVVKDSGGFLYSDYILHLIDADLLKEVNTQSPGDYILYFNPVDHPGDITHGGILTSDITIVRSKWAWGPLFEHKIFDVPYSYGNVVKYFRRTDKDTRDTYFKHSKFNTK